MIPRLTATHFQRFMSSGRTSPALCGCADSSERDAGDYVVKLRGLVDNGDAGLINELLAVKLARHFRLATPEPAIIVLDRLLVELIIEKHPSRQDALQRSVGVNFGTKHLTGVSTWPVDKPIPEEYRATAAEIFAFDALLQNPDRRFVNPNLFVQGLTIFDHEAAFSFLLDVLPPANPWDVERQQFLEKHVFYRRLKSKPIELEGFIAALTDLSDTVLEGMVAEVPSEWDNQECMRRIVGHLQTVRDHAEEFAESIRRVLG